MPDVSKNVYGHGCPPRPPLAGMRTGGQRKIHLYVCDAFGHRAHTLVFDDALGG
jgi:hypothetical protein